MNNKTKPNVRILIVTLLIGLGLAVYGRVKFQLGYSAGYEAAFEKVADEVREVTKTCSLTPQCQHDIEDVTDY